jgi:hypothetical protein
MALANTTPAYCCIVLQQQLEDIMGDKAPGQVVEETGMVNALTSPLNTTGFEVVNANGFPGKGIPTSGQLRPKIEIRFEKPICDDVEEDDIQGLCGTGETFEPYAYKEFQINQDPLSRGFRIDQSDFDRICEGRDERITMLLRRTAISIRKKLEQKLIGLVYANAGNYPKGANSVTNPFSLPVVGVHQGQPYANPAALMPIKSAYRQMHTATPPIMVGGEGMARHFDLRSMSGLGSNALFANPTDFGGITPVYSTFVDEVINDISGNGVYSALTWLPGTVQLVTWNKYTGERVMAKEDYAKTTLNIDGILYDYTINYDKCDDVWFLELSLHYDLLNLTNEMAPCFDFNYILNWELECGDSTCDFLLPSLGASSEGDGDGDGDGGGGEG